MKHIEPNGADRASASKAEIARLDAAVVALDAAIDAARSQVATAARAVQRGRGGPAATLALAVAHAKLSALQDRHSDLTRERRTTAGVAAGHDSRGHAP